MPRVRRSGGTATSDGADLPNDEAHTERGVQVGTDDRSPEEQADYDAAGGAQGEMDRATAGTPVLGWLLGADAREAARLAAEQESQRMGIWNDLGGTMPSVDALTSRYQEEGTTDEYGNMLGGASRLEGMDPTAQRQALEGLQKISQGGGYTTQDRAQMQAQRLREGQALAGANEAAIQQMQARGMGGGGAELAARLGGTAAYANANAQADAAIGAAGQQRALQALAAQGQLGGQMYGQEAQRRAQLDAWNQQGLDWRRGRTTRNTDIRNRGEDSRSAAEQTAWGNRYGVASGKTNYNNQLALAAGQRSDSANEAAAGTLGTIIDEIL